MTTDATSLEDVLTTAQLHQGIKSRLGDIRRILGTQRLRENIANAHGLDDRADGLAADQPRSRARGF